MGGGTSWRKGRDRPGKRPFGPCAGERGDIAQGCSTMPDHWLRTLPYNEWGARPPVPLDEDHGTISQFEPQISFFLSFWAGLGEHMECWRIKLQSILGQSRAKQTP